jgi:hypothetical protein
MDDPTKCCKSNPWDHAFVPRSAIHLLIRPAIGSVGRGVVEGLWQAIALLFVRLPLLLPGWRWLRQYGAGQIIICHGPQHLAYGSIVRRLCNTPAPFSHRSIFFGSRHRKLQLTGKRG